VDYINWTLENSRIKSEGEMDLRRTTFTTGVALCLGTSIYLAGCAPKNAPVVGEHLPGAGYNVAVILVDTLRPDHLGSYGYDRDTSPALDEFFKGGVLFENAYSASTFTGEAVSALFTGRPPALNATGLGWTARPTPQEENLPKLLEAAGYKTGIFSSSFVMRFRGFYDSFQEGNLFQGEELNTMLDERVTDAALEFAEKHRDAPTFQYLHYYAPHLTYNPPAAHLEAFELDRAILDPEEELHTSALVCRGMTADDPRIPEFKKHYDGEIVFSDQTVRRYLDGLKDLGLLSKTIVVFVSDHGEEFLEHGFAGHAWNLYEESLRIPMVIWAPELLEPQRVQEPASICDVMPTVLRLLQMPHAGYNSPLAGQYLVDAGESAWQLTPRSEPIYASLFPESRAQLHAVLFENYKYISGPRWLSGEACKKYWLLQGVMGNRAKESGFRPLDPWARSNGEALFDLAADKSESNNLVSQMPDVADRGRALLDAYKAASIPYLEDGPDTSPTDPFGEAFVESGMELLTEGAQDLEEGENEEGERITPDIIEGLETMGYL
jgi:arylsulfatase A-like enzyme